MQNEGISSTIWCLCHNFYNLILALSIAKYCLAENALMSARQK